MADTSIVNSEIIRRYEEDGVVLLRNVLDPMWMQLIEAGIKRNRSNPGPFAEMFYAGEQGEFYDDYGNFDVIPEYKILLECSPIADIMTSVLQTKNLWLYYDQIFIKEGESRRTPWHQDTSYWIAEGENIGSAWITLEPVSGAEALEFVLGSHRGPLYNAAVFTTDGDKDWYKDSGMDPVPNIDGEREKWNIASWDVNPGDILILHPSILHGGASIPPGGCRRTMSIRFFGDDVRYVERPGTPAPPFYGVSQSLKPGDLLRHPYFPLIRGE